MAYGGGICLVGIATYTGILPQHLLSVRCSKEDFVSYLIETPNHMRQEDRSCHQIGD